MNSPKTSTNSLVFIKNTSISEFEITKRGVTKTGTVDSMATLASAFSTTTKFLKQNRMEIAGLLLLLLISAFLRFYQLGYSDFYGDETKTFYWNKTIPATQFLLNQRKGPVQFLVVWGMEKLTGGYNELATRLPFAFSSLLSVFVFYAFIRKRHSKEAAFFGSFAFSVLGFSIAFGRIVQYQSFLFLFGFLSLLFANLSATAKDNKALFLSGVFLGLAFLTHYDAIFITLPIGYLLWKTHRKNLKRLRYALIPFLGLIAMFYIPYFVRGNVKEVVGGYLYRRLTGSELNTNNSYYTFLVYNPSLVWVTVLFFSVVGFVKTKPNSKWLFLLWFMVPFILFEVVFSNPGTHIYNYLIPLMVLFGISVSAHKSLKYIFSIILAIVLIVNIGVYIPRYNTTYPWVDLFPLRGGYQIFLYGFPYNRGWNEIAEYLELKGVRSFYTNGNVTVGEWYLLGIPADKHNPHYFISMDNNQELRRSFSGDSLNYSRVSGFLDFPEKYTLVKQIFVGSEKTADIYKRPVREN